MKHKIGYNRLGRKASHRRAMMRNMATSLFRYERIKTTKPKAKELRRFAERLLTRAKIDTVHNRRIVAQSIGDKEIVAKLFTDLGPRFDTRPGGYTRIIGLGQRQGDAADMVFIELVEEMTQTGPRNKKSAAPKKAPAKEPEAADSDADGTETSVADSDEKDATVDSESADESTDTESEAADGSTETEGEDADESNETANEDTDETSETDS